MNDRSVTATIKVGVLAIVAAVGITLFAHWEPSGETWYYWFFSKQWLETGTFCIPDRSPLYTLYLTLFSWIGYPLSVTVEYAVTTLLTAAALMVLFRRYFSFGMLAFLMILWIPFLQVSEPPVQKLALACVCLAVALRQDAASRLARAGAYALLVMAVMFRGSYALVLAGFVVMDAWFLIRGRMPWADLMPRRQDWPVLVVILLSVWFGALQSEHRWNGLSPLTAQWTPTDNKSLANAAFLQNYNQIYIADTYGSFKDKDWYFTNKEAFGGATTIVGAFHANPKLVIKIMFRNFKVLLTGGADFTLVPHLIYSKLSAGSKWWYPVHALVTLPIIALIVYGAWRAAAGVEMRWFLLANVMMFGSLILAQPRERYFFPLIPILILSAAFYLGWVKERMGKKGLYVVGICTALVLIMLFSKGLRDWSVLLQDLGRDIKQGDVRVMETRTPFSMKASVSALAPVAASCRGIMSAESLFMAAYMNVPADRVYNLLDLPPFGSLENPGCDLLTPDKINCVLISRRVENDIGGETNEQMRYDHYIKPYVKRLEAAGARRTEIPSYGTVTVPERP